MQERLKPTKLGLSVMSSNPEEFAPCVSISVAREDRSPVLLTSRRWERWAAVCRVRGMDVDECQVRHGEAVLHLRRMGVSSRRIKAMDLDDPRLSAEERRALCQR
jgi:hypothetical protein